MYENNPMEFLAKSASGESGGGVAQTDADPLKAMSLDEFAALGDDEIVYRRTVSGAILKKLVPQAEGAPDTEAFHVLFGAGGAPRFVSDDERQMHEWLDRTGLSIATRH